MQELNVYEVGLIKNVWRNQIFIHKPNSYAEIKNLLFLGQFFYAGIRFLYKNQNFMAEPKFYTVFTLVHKNQTFMQ